MFSRGTAVEDVMKAVSCRIAEVGLSDKFGLLRTIAAEVVMLLGGPFA